MDKIINALKNLKDIGELVGIENEWLLTVQDTSDGLIWDMKLENPWKEYDNDNGRFVFDGEIVTEKEIREELIDYDCVADWLLGNACNGKLTETEVRKDILELLKIDKETIAKIFKD